MDIKTFILPLTLIVLFVYETAAPFYHFNVNRFRHGIVNIGAGFLSFLLATVFFYYLVMSALAIDKGFSSLIPSDVFKLIFAVILFDLWMYIWHRMNHEISFFWRFHKAHHSDTAMDVTTGLRFHPVELILSTGIRLPIYMLLGINVYIIAIYEILSGVVIFFHHSNISLKQKLDDVLSFVIPTPRMHRVHHSHFVKETNSNYGTLFSFWDRIFGTFNSRSDIENIKIGLENYRTDYDQTFTGFLKTPFN
ncbi:MAG: sterol desaturase [Denitrovibrio sp.]|nr:MAG: sterol desaturase [Denitrovibrio sp.]